MKSSITCLIVGSCLLTRLSRGHADRISLGRLLEFYSHTALAGTRVGWFYNQPGQGGGSGQVRLGPRWSSLLSLLGSGEGCRVVRT